MIVALIFALLLFSSPPSSGKEEYEKCDFGDEYHCGDSTGFWEKAAPGGDTCYCWAGQFNPGKHWEESIKHCNDLGGYMVEPRTAAEGNYMLERMMEIYPLVPPNLWIGLSDQQEEGVFRWLSDNSTLTEEFWIAGQPDNGGILPGGAQNCVNMVIAALGYWDDANCGDFLTKTWACQRPAPK